MLSYITLCDYKPRGNHIRQLAISNTSNEFPVDFDFTRFLSASFWANGFVYYDLINKGINQFSGQFCWIRKRLNNRDIL